MIDADMRIDDNIDPKLANNEVCEWSVTMTLRKFVAENYTEKFDALKFTLKNNIKEDSTENHTETIPLLFRNAQNR